MIKTLSLNPVPYVLKEEKDAENPTKFYIKPMTYGDFQDDIAMVRVEVKDGVSTVANSKEIEVSFFKKYIVKIENIEIDGEAKTIENPEDIYKAITRLTKEQGAELKEVIEGISTLSLDESKN